MMRIERGTPTPEELAAVLAVVTARAAAAAAVRAPEPAPTSAWVDRSRTMTRTPPVGRNAWKTSAW